MRTCAAAFMVAAVLPSASVVAQAPTTAFIDVSVVPLDRERVLSHQTVVVRGDRIVAMGPVKQVAVPAAAARVDGRGKFLMPGLTDMHTHVAMGLTDSLPAERRLLLLLANGITTIRNLDYTPKNFSLGGDELLRLRARVAAGEVRGPRIYAAGEWYADTTKSIAHNVEAYKAQGYDLIKVHHDFGWDRAKMERTVLGLAPERDAVLSKLDSLAEAAHRVGMPIAGHPVGGLAWALEQRFASVEHLEGFPGGFPPVRGVTLADTSKFLSLVAAAKKAGVSMTPTLALVESAFAGFYSSSMQDFTVGIDVLRRLVVTLQAAGVNLLVGTDAPFGIAPGKGVHEELAALVRAGLTPYQALVAGTRNAAAYFGTVDSVGTIAVGKRADVVLLAANPLTNIRHTEQIAGVMAAGRWFDIEDLVEELLEFPRQWFQAEIMHSGVVYDAQTSNEQRRRLMEHMEEILSASDSLSATVPKSPEYERWIQALTQEIGTMRAVLTPKQYPAFDPMVRLWLRAQTRRGYRVAIAGVAP